MNTKYKDPKRLFNPRYFLLLALLAVAAILAGVSFSWIFLLAAGVLLTVLFAVIMALTKKHLFFLSACLLIMLFFSVYASCLDKQIFYEPPVREVVLTGRVVSSWEKKEDRYTVRLSDCTVVGQDNVIPLKYKTVLYVDSTVKPEFKYGDQLIMACSLYNIQPPSNPGQPNFKRINLGAGVAYNAFADTKDIEKCGHTDDLYGIFVTVREKLCTNIESALSERNASIIEGMLLGKDDTIYSEIIDQFKQMGIIHILSVSGLHVMIIALALRFLLKKLKVPAWVRFAVIVFFLACYSAVAAFEPPVLRAAFMAALLMYADSFGERYDGLNVLGAAALLLLLINPMQLFRVGFMLTFLACAGIFLYADVIKIKQPVLKQVVSGVMLTVSAQLGVLPVLINTYGYLSVVSVVTNAVLALPVSLLIILSFIFGVVSLIVQPLGVFLLGLLNYCTDAFMYLAGLFDPVSRYMPKIHDMPPVAVLLYYLLLVLFSRIVLRKLWKKLAATAVLISVFLKIFTVWVCLIVFFAGIQIPLQGNQKIVLTVLAVGNADCSIITAPDRSVYMVDAASSSKINKYLNDSAKMVLLPYLRQKGIYKINGLFLTHSDGDHAGGLLEMYDEVEIESIYYNPLTLKDEKILTLLHQYKKRGTELIEVWEGLNINLEDRLSCEVLYPFKDSQYHDNVSLALRFTANETAVLFAGDNEEKDLEALIQRKDVRCDIILAPHHGSEATAYTGLYWEADPELILVSSNNDFTFRTQNAKIYHTKYSGALTVQMLQGQKPSVSVYK